MSLKYIDLFCGIGGFHQAMKDLHPDSECVLACDIEPDTRVIYELNHDMTPVGDIYDIASKDIPEHDILFGGFPCQPFSSTNRYHTDKDKKGILFEQIVRFLKVKQPEYFLLENVRNIQRIQNGAAFARIKVELTEAGYEVYTQVLCATDFGLPQARYRMFFVGVRKDIQHPFEFPKGDPTKMRLLKDVLHPWDENSLYRASDKIIQHRRANRLEQARIDGKDETWAIPPIDLNFPRIWDYNPAKRKGELFCRVNISKKSIAHTLRALCDPAAHLINGILRYSPREQLLLQGFPKDFQHDPDPRVAQRHAGNAVAVPVVEAILKELLK